MTWTIWINFIPLSHGGSTWKLASIGPVVSERIFEHTHTYIHTLTREPSALNKLYMYSCTPEHNSWELFQMTKYGVGERGLKAKHYIFVSVRVVGLLFCFVFFSIQWAVGFCKNVFFSAGGGPSQKCSCYVVIQVESDSRCSVSNVYWN